MVTYSTILHISFSFHNILVDKIAPVEYFGAQRYRLVLLNLTVALPQTALDNQMSVKSALKTLFPPLAVPMHIHVCAGRSAQRPAPSPAPHAPGAVTASTAAAPGQSSQFG